MLIDVRVHHYFGSLLFSNGVASKGDEITLSLHSVVRRENMEANFRVICVFDSWLYTFSLVSEWRDDCWINLCHLFEMNPRWRFVYISLRFVEITLPNNKLFLFATSYRDVTNCHSFRDKNATLQNENVGIVAFGCFRKRSAIFVVIISASTLRERCVMKRKMFCFVWSAAFVGVRVPSWWLSRLYTSCLEIMRIFCCRFR